MNKPLLLASIDVESWICSDLFNSSRTLEQETNSIEQPLKWILSLLKKYHVKMTFFYVGLHAKIRPDLVKLIIKDGHEIASHGYSHQSLTNISPKKAFFELVESKKVLEEIIGCEVIGYRSPSAKSNSNLLLLKKAGYKYDSSLVHSLPIPRWYGDLTLPPKPFSLNSLEKYNILQNKIIEFPISSNPFVKLPMSAWWIRNLGKRYFLNSVKYSLKFYKYCSFYMHPWEFSEYFPSKKNVPFHVYRRIGNYMRSTFEDFLKKWSSTAKITTYKSIYENDFLN